MCSRCENAQKTRPTNLTRKRKDGKEYTILNISTIKIHMRIEKQIKFYLKLRWDCERETNATVWHTDTIVNRI